MVADDLHGLLILPNVGEAAPPSPSFTPPPPSPSYTASAADVPAAHIPAPDTHSGPDTDPGPDANTHARPDAHADPGARLAVGTSVARGEPEPGGRRGPSWQPPATQGTASVTGYRIYPGTGARPRRRWSPWAPCLPSPMRRS